MKLTKALLLAIITISIQGCMGLGGIIVTDHTVTIEQPLLSSEKGQIFDNYKASRTADTATVREYWGPPDSVSELAQGRLRWDYHYGLRWNGLGMLVIIVPVPLVLPLGHNYVSLEFEGDRIVSATVKEWKIAALAHCGFFVMVPGGWICGGTIYSPNTITHHTRHYYETEHLLPGQSFDMNADEKLRSDPKTQVD